MDVYALVTASAKEDEIQKFEAFLDIHNN